MGLLEITERIKHQLPAFNDELIRGRREKEMRELPEFIAERYQECADFVDPEIKLTHYELMPPASRLQFETRSPKQLNVVNIRDDEAMIVTYYFKYGDEEFSHNLYIPYIYEDSSVVVGGTRYECLLGMVEKLFSTQNRDSGVTIKVIRSPLTIWGNLAYPLKCLSSGSQFYGTAVSTQIYGKESVRSAKKTKPTVVLYLLCRFSLPDVLEKFGLPRDGAEFVQTKDFDQNYYYFKAQDRAIDKDPVLLQVKKELMTDRVMVDVAAAIVYTMSSTRIFTFNELQIDSTQVFKMLLGKLIYSNGVSKLDALGLMTKHIESLETYLDNYTKQVLHTNGFFVEDIYDLLVVIAKNINTILLSCPNNNMFNKRLEAINNAVIDGMFNQLYLQVYNLEKKRDRKISQALRTSPREILKTLGRSENVRFSSAVYGDNWLLSIGSKMVKRLSASKSSAGKRKVTGGTINAPVNRFHPSMMVVESCIGFSSAPGQNVLLNPYAIIDDLGGFIKDEFADEVEKDFKQYLPR